DYAQYGRASRRGRQGHAIDRQHAGYYRARKCNPGTEEGVRGNQGTEGRALQRKHCPAPRNRKHVDVRGGVRHFFGVAERAGAGRESCADRFICFDRGRDGDRKGVDRAGDSQEIETWRAFVRWSELRGDPLVVDHVRIVRPRERSVYGSSATAAWTV